MLRTRVRAGWREPRVTPRAGAARCRGPLWRTSRRRCAPHHGSSVDMKRRGVPCLASVACALQAALVRTAAAPTDSLEAAIAVRTRLRPEVAWVAQAPACMATPQASLPGGEEGEW
jgi:hypothetical protein